MAGLPRAARPGMLTGFAPSILAVPPPHPDLTQAQVQEPESPRGPPPDFFESKEDQEPRPAKVGGLRWWLRFAWVGFIFFLFGFILSGGVGFTDAGKPPEDCWHFHVVKVHEECKRPQIAVTEREQCKLASAYFHGKHKEDGDPTNTAHSPGCYCDGEKCPLSTPDNPQGVIVWDTEHDLKWKVDTLYMICRGTRITDTQKCQENWEHRINGVGWMAVVGCIFSAACVVFMLVTCFNKGAAGMCRFYHREAGEPLAPPSPHGSPKS
eukprot:TRINITY_DN60632_c0_g1_i1.p1 TRINITY_DN60632_c0_g1~~TRINITY_DN60632_c0_g1_i1.p1  ORF type:complete len:292 (+),score=62.67 TRINITY_DN60632_c0_g1_i1:81-878(+)